MRADRRGGRFGPAAWVGLALAGLVLAGCAELGPEPWNRDLLAEREMQMDAHATALAADEHIYFSKEGSAGGRTFDGGGCGCN